MYKVGHRNIVLLGVEAHRQFIAKVAHRGITHTGHAQVFPQGRGRPHVIIIQGNNAIDDARAREEADPAHHIVHFRQVGHVEYLVDALARPVRMFQRWCGEQNRVTTLALAFADKLLPLLVTADAEHSFRSSICHRRHSWHMKVRLSHKLYGVQLHYTMVDTIRRYCIWMGVVARFIAPEKTGELSPRRHECRGYALPRFTNMLMCLGKVPPRKLYRHNIHQFARHINHLAHGLTCHESLHLLGGHSLLLYLLLGRIIRDIYMVAHASNDLHGKPYHIRTYSLRIEHGPRRFVD